MRHLSRRMLLIGSGLAIACRSGNGSSKPKVVVVGGHPGDPEYGCGGTVARFSELGHAVTLVYLNRGEKGCGSKSAAACGAIRTAEAEEACRVLKANARFATFVDGEAVVSPVTYSAFHELIASEQPNVILTHWPIDNHPDHRAASLLAYEAWRRLPARAAFYYYEVSNGEDTLMFEPTDYVDISRTEPLKRSACYAHASQSPDKFYSLQTQVACFRGIESGYRYAEAFIRHVESPGHVLPD
jgi:LmbE family N-acetylglucosaminyl deacetylase